VSGVRTTTQTLLIERPCIKMDPEQDAPDVKKFIRTYEGTQWARAWHDWPRPYAPQL
jgi:hypothetical protein